MIQFQGCDDSMSYHVVTREMEIVEEELEKKTAIEEERLKKEIEEVCVL